jgi:hypothetical protein
MERRNFLRTLIGGVAVAAAIRTWPFRVYSFPSEPVTLGPTRFDILDLSHWAQDSRRREIKEAWQCREFYAGQQYFTWNGQSWAPIS